MPCGFNINTKGNGIKHRSVTDDCFPYVTGYATQINILNGDKLLERDLMDIVNRDYKYAHYQHEIRDNELNFESLNFGIVNTNFGGYGQYMIEFDIWNNEPGATFNFTKIIRKDATNCNVYITDSNYNRFHDSIVSFNIRDVNKREKFQHLDGSYSLTGNYNPNVKGLLSGMTDHIKFDLIVQVLKMNKPVCKNDISFNVCFEYTVDTEIIDFYGNKTNKVQLNFPCKIELTNKEIEQELISYGNNRGVYTGKFEGLNVIKNNFPTTIMNVKNGLTLYDKYVFNGDIYNCFLPRGIYDFEIVSNGIQENFNGIKICKGIEPYYNVVNWSQIYNICDDTLILLYKKDRTRMVFGAIYDQYESPIDGAEIIISSYNKLLLYYKTGEDGKYRFTLPNFCNYQNINIRLRSKNHTIKIIENFKYNPEIGFIKQLQMSNNQLIHGFNFKEV